MVDINGIAHIQLTVTDKQRHPGLRHFCIRVRSYEGADEVYAIAKEPGAKILKAQRSDHTI